MTAVTTEPARKTIVEHGGIEAIPLERRHGSPWQLLATWSAPNLEFATIFVGVIAVAFFGLSFWQAVAAMVLGNGLGALTHGVLSSWGPRDGVAQMVLGRVAFGTRGNILPAALNTVMAGLGWFATNSVSGAFALTSLTGLPLWLSLLIIVVLEVALAFIGHDIVQLFERYATVVLGIIFLLATVSVLVAGSLGAGANGHPAAGSFAGITLTVAAAFGYAAGWNPYATDYARYLPARTSRLKTGLAAGIGNFLSCTVLMVAGAAAATLVHFNADNPTDSFTAVDAMPTVIGKLTLLAIAVGAIAANALNIYSGAMSFLAAGVRIPFSLRRAIVALGFGVIGFFIALAASADPKATYENFLLVIAYWIAPWLGVVLTDRYFRRGTRIAELLGDDAKYRNWAGLIAFVVGLVISVWLFSSQTLYTGPIAKAAPIGDLTPLVGFVLAAVLYAVLFPVFKPGLGGPLPPDGIEMPPAHVDAASAE
ncbi:MAG: nucleobase:cation symporter, family [Microbacteriaceae bacterium]|nr:nucleobase:cation symporter, family [Microbacteriaceae bacterium]